MSATPDEPDKEPSADRPGKIRTWWHPLLANFLRWQLGGHYQLFEEFPVGQKPLQIDILLLHKQPGELPEKARKTLAGLVERLNDYTMLELKSPSDTLRSGDFQTFLAYALLYRAQNLPRLEPGRLSLIVIAPRLTRPYEDELRLLGVAARQEREGVWRLEGPTLGHAVWLLETETLAVRNHPVLSLVSPRFLRQGQQTYEELHQSGYTELVVYMAQQVQQFRRQGKEFAMQHLGAEDEMAQVVYDLLASMTPEELLRQVKRLGKEVAMRHLGADDELAKILREMYAEMPEEERLAIWPPEERLALLSPEQRLAGLSPEQRLAGLSPEELDRLKELIQRSTKPNGSSTHE